MAYIVSSGITSTGISLSYNSMTVLDGGTADKTTLYYSGYLRISSGGTANSNTVNSGGYLYVYSGGTANSTTVNSRGYSYIRGGLANYTTINNSGYLGVYSGGMANSTIVNGFASFGIGGNEWGIASSTIINSNGRLEVYSGGTANDNTFNGGYLFVSSGGTANNNTANFGAKLFVSSEGTANSNTVNNGGHLVISSGGTATDIIENGGYVEVQGGASAAFVSNTFSGLILRSGASATVHSGTTATDVTIDQLGYFAIYSGGTATGLVWTPCNGTLWVEDGAYVTYGNLPEGVFFGGGGVLSSNAMTMEEITVLPNQTMYVMSNGIANSTTVSSAGIAYVSSGGLANSTTLNAYGRMFVYSGGTANSTTVSSRGSMFISIGGLANSTTVNNGGNTYVVSGGTAAGVTINSGGILRVSSGGTAINVDWTPCFGDVLFEDGAQVTFTSEYSGVYYGSNNVFLSQAQIIQSIAISGSMCVMSDGAVNRITVDGGAKLTVSGGGSANSTTVNGTLNISSGGTANSTTVNSSGYLYIYSGTANSTTLNAYGRMFVYSGGTANSTSKKDGWMYVEDGGMANSTIIDWGSMYVSSGGTANSTTLNNGWMNVSSGGTANDNTVNGGYLTIIGGTANNTIVNIGQLFVYNGGYASHVVLIGKEDRQSGDIYVSYGGTVENVTVERYGDYYVSSGGTAKGTTVNTCGGMWISSGGTATDIVENGGYVYVGNGAEVSFLKHSFNGLGLLNASATLHSGTTANSAILNSAGILFVSSGGTANLVTVNAGGSLHLYHRGVVNSAAIYSNGIIYLSSGGILTGRTYCLGGIIYAYDGAIVNYDLTRTNPGAFTLISDLSCIQGTTDYTITVNADQAEGTYILAEVASSFDQTITVKNVVGDELGVLSVGQTVAISGVDYTLNLTDNTLSLKIGKTEPSSPYTSDGLFFWNETGSVESGELYHDTLILSGGALIVSGGGSANSTTVSAGGYLHVSSAAAAHAIVENGGYVAVEDGAEATFQENTISGLWLNNTSATIHSGTTANNATIYISGYLDVFGGSANGATVYSSGFLRVYDGGSANGATVYSSGFLRVYDGGSANSTTVYSGGNLNISSGGTANNTIVCGYSRIVANLNVYSGGMASNTTVSGGHNYGYAYLNVYNGGVASNAIVSGSGSYGYGYLNVFSGGTANNATIKTSGYFIVSSGGVANSTTVSFGQLHVSNGGYVSQAIIFGKTDRQQGDIYLSNGATAEDVTVEQFGDYYVSSGGTANNTTINVYGGMWVSSGGTATEIKENGGYVWVQNGANAVFASNTFSGAVLNSAASATVHSGTTAVNITLNQSGYLAVYSGGTVTGLDWMPCNGTLWVEEGAHVIYGNLPEGVFYGGGGILSSNAMTMEEITVLPNQMMYVMSNGIANSTTVSSAGSVVVSGGGLANSTTVFSAGSMFVSSGGTAYNATVLSSGYMRVISGGSAAHIEARSGALLDLSIAPDTYIEGTYADSAFEVKDGSATYYSVNSGNILRVSSGGMASRTYVYAGGNLYVSNGGIANRTVLSNGAMSISSGGIATSTTINYGAAFICSGGTADTVIVNNGNLYISSGGYGNAVTMNNETGLYISSGGIVNNATVNNNAWLYVSAGGTATDLTATGTRLRFDITPDTYIAGTSAGFDFEIKDGVISDYSVNYGGYLNIFSGGTANNVTVNASGYINIISGGTANSTTVNGNYYSQGGLSISQGGVANNTIVNAYGRMWISSGVIVNSTTINNGGSMWISSGANANDLLINNGGRVWQYSATASDTTINQGGNMWVSSGGTVTELRVNSGGYLYFEHAKLTGKITIADGGTIQAGQGAVIDFDISRLAPNMGALLNNLSRIQNDAPAFTLTVSDVQWNGTYKLAQGVTEFDNLISVKSTASQTIHMVAVDETANVDGIEYTLKLSDGTLAVTVTGGVDIPIIPVSADVTDPTRSPVTVMADFSDAAIMREYSFDNDTWHVYTEPVTFRQNGTVYFLGKDQRGFINEVASYDVTNIDLTPPENPTASADITDPTNTDVVVTATFSEDAKLKEYSRDGEKWLVYTDAIIFEQNGTAYFRATDALGNESEVISYSVTNIDKTPPAAPTARANTTNPTNQTVKVSASFSNDTTKREYSLDGETWSNYSSAIQFTENGTVYFRATDAVGNVSEITTFEVTNIDTIKPDMPTVSADVTELTNTDVLVTAEFSEDSSRKEYSFDGNSWRTYSGAVRLTGNGTVYFRGTDAAGNVSEVASYTVDYIDKSAPNKPTAYADVTNITNGNVFVSAVYSEDSVAYEYSLDNKEWLEYTDAVMFAENGTVYFRGIDEAGNYSGVTKYVVSNIDKTVPSKPTASADVTEITSGDVTVSAVFSDDSAVKEYSLDGRTWKPYTEAIKFVKNGNIYFRSFDTAGNVSEVAGYTVNNIIKAAPEKPSISVDVASPTSGTVTVSAVFSDELTTNQYSLDGETWLDYTGPVTFTENGNVSFRSVDLAENVSEIVTYQVTNIDKTPPEKPMTAADITTPTNGDVLVTATFGKDAVTCEYSLDGIYWGPYVGGVIFTSNRKAYFRSIDAAGNISEVGEYEVTNIDRTAPNKPAVSMDISTPTNRSVTVSAKFDEDSATKEYSLDGEEWLKYTDAILCAKNETVSFRGIDEAGNVSEIVSLEVNNIDTTAPSDPTGLQAIVSEQTVALVWSASMDDSGVKEYVVTYALSGQEFTDRTSGTSYVLSNAGFGTYSWSVQAVDFAGNESAATNGDAFTVSGFKPYTVEYSADNFEHTFRFTVTTPKLNTVRMPSGTYQMRVRAEGSSEWISGDPIVAAELDDTPQLIKSDADGNADVFFANPVGTWESGYVAQHVGSINDWSGTNEYTAVFGKNKLADIIEGSTDANILLMTDDANGDALFVDDIYTASPGSIAEKQSRIAQIDEIRAGAGNDIVDMTSQQFEYIGDGLTIRGGEGNDTIWANKGNNWLFGDAGNDRIVGASGNDVIAGGIGNDRMHGGGGNDVFTFCENWGADNVEQLATGSVTLWFASGSIDKWDASELTYTDGENSVKVSGVTADKVTLKFGDDGSDEYNALASAGAFFDATTERIFEESGKGILASL